MVTVVTDDLVVGDIVQISAGDTVPADGIYISGNNLKMDESKLTGESDQVAKGAKNPFIVSSSECHDGSCLMLVTAVGPNSVFGRMKTMIEGDNEGITPLQAKLSKLSTQISVLGAVVGVGTVAIMIIKHIVNFAMGNGNASWNASDWMFIVDAFVIGVTILVVAIPEGLPLAVTIALAYSVKRMMKDNNLVRHLNACETMGGANTICSDKTGTLTQNQMTVMQGWVYKPDAEDQSKMLNEYKKSDDAEYEDFLKKCKELPEGLRELLLQNALLNNEAFLTQNTDGKEVGVGSAIEVAMLKWARRMGIDYVKMRTELPQKKEDDGKPGVIKLYPFHSNRKRSSCLVRLPNGKYRLYVKGAPEMVIRLCDYIAYDLGKANPMTGKFVESDGKVEGEGKRKNIVENCIYPMAKQALRVLAFAYRDFDEPVDWDEMVQYATEEQKGVGDCPKVESNLTMIGLLGVQDPVRGEVPDSVLKCQKAGIFVRMVTGDNMETAKAIARQCHIYQNKEWTDGQGKRYPPGRAILGSQFREIVGGLVLPPHFYHECHCKDCSKDKYFVPDYKTPDYPVHFGYPSIVGHKDHHCADWTEEAKKKRGSDPKSQCTEECKQRGCMYQVKNPKDERQLQQFYVVKNQAQFDQFVDTLQVMARSAPTDKHLLVTGLMERQQVVAVTGDGTNDGPALSKSNVGFAMGITGTSVAKDASDIVLMDDNFTSIVKAVMWGRNVYDSIRKFIQFQLTVNVGALLLAFVSACIINESPLKAVQLLWVNLIMDTFAALALATELPTEQLLERGPCRRDESLISSVMLRNILGQMLYQFTMLMFLVFQGFRYFNIPNGMDLGESASPTVHYTLVFNIFVMMQVFNEFNSRKINNECNVFSHIFDNYLFWVIIIGTIIVQLIIVEIGGEVMSTTTLSWSEIGISILLGALCLVYQQLIRTIPGSIFLDLNGDESNSVSSVWERFLRVDSSKWELPSVTTLTFSQKPAALRRIDTTM
ncbi:uncharacterized protein [Blastocystis hominis]|uniref:P-type sodium-transporting ATPase4 n=1 Tax=Blastocystis hominis TaxID=12968 RepID=D8LUR0_BLAHO|nr:uncharacterized protein [Blastocystis hominis]CBK19549.2 unnamed protein product [Blastocystis hominis]|eukprot:XP_012893597.1 uncharacterized protein [Blastocystis hominis]